MLTQRFFPKVHGIRVRKRKIEQSDILFCLSNWQKRFNMNMSNFGKDVGKYPLSITDGECMNFIICRKTIEQYLSILKF